MAVFFAFLLFVAIGALPILAAVRRRSTSLSPESLRRRLATVFLGEVLGLFFYAICCFLPAAKSLDSLVAWQRECIEIGLGTTVLVFLVFLAGFVWESTAGQQLTPERKAKVFVALIGSVYFLSACGLLMATIRSGGVRHSPFTHFISLQLAGFLLLELQEGTAGRAALAWCYLLFSVLAWAGAALFDNQLNYLLWGRGAEQLIPDWPWHPWLPAVAMVITFLGYWLPKRGFFDNRWFRVG